MKLGYIGLGKMGKNMVLHLAERGIKVTAWNRSSGPRDEVQASGVATAATVEELVQSQVAPRVIWLMLPAGAPTDEMVSTLLPLLSSGDLVIDGANSRYTDSLRHAKQFEERGIEFVDIGVSGGPSGARAGACLMIGGKKEQVERVHELIVACAAPGAWAHVGSVGAGHFTKMVHNGIEYGMMEAIGEGMAVLATSPFSIDLAEVARIYNSKSVIESRLVGWTHEALVEDPRLEEITSTIAASGEGEWTMIAAQELGVSVPVIEASFRVRQESAGVDPASPDAFRNKVVSAQRGKFGGHEVKKK